MNGDKWDEWDEITAERADQITDFLLTRGMTILIGTVTVLTLVTVIAQVVIGA